jgi:hypothetical protein
MPNQTDLFFYLAAFVTVVLGLALSDMVQSLHRLLRAGARVRWSPLPVLAAGLVAAALLAQFFLLWEYLGPRRFSFLDLLGALAPSVLITLPALAALPDEVPAEGLDLEAFYFENRRYFFGALLASLVADLLSLFCSEWGAEDYLLGYAIYATISAPVVWLILALRRSASRRLHLIGLLLLIPIMLLEASLYEIGLTPTR